MRASVLLPAPFSPISACTSPAASSKRADVSAAMPPKCLLILRASRSGAMRRRYASPAATGKCTGCRPDRRKLTQARCLLSLGRPGHDLEACNLLRGRPVARLDPQRLAIIAIGLRVAAGIIFDHATGIIRDLKIGCAQR